MYIDYIAIYDISWERLVVYVPPSTSLRISRDKTRVVVVLCTVDDIACATMLQACGDTYPTVGGPITSTGGVPHHPTPLVFSNILQLLSGSGPGGTLLGRTTVHGPGRSCRQVCPSVQGRHVHSYCSVGVLGGTPHVWGRSAYPQY